MTSPVFSLPPTASLREAKSLMTRERIHHIVVVDHKVPVGLLSDYELRDAADEGTCGAAMSSGVATVEPRTTARDAANLLRGRAVGCLAVVDDGKLVGVVTVSDLLEMVGGGADRPPQATRRVLSGRGPRAKDR